MRAWGFCQRHAWVTLVVELALRPGYLLGPAILYTSLAEQGTATFKTRGLDYRRLLARRLKSRGPCIVCDANIRGGGALRLSVLEQARNPGRLRGFASQFERFWSPYVCPRCSGASSSHFLCRRHLRESLTSGIHVDLALQRSALTALTYHLGMFQKSFTFGYRGTDAPENRAALISMIGWCAGWRLLIELVGTAKPIPEASDGGSPSGT